MADYPTNGSPGNASMFAERLRKARQLRDLEQAQLALIANIPAPSINHFERGRRKPNLNNLVRLADALIVSTDYLLGRTDLALAHLTAPEKARAPRLTRQEDIALMQKIEEYLDRRARDYAELD